MAFKIKLVIFVQTQDMESTYRIQHLIENVGIISKKYDDIAKLTGENFNIFSVMSMQSNERYTHSAILGELLNPKGSHGQGSVFLKLFFDEIHQLRSIKDFDFENAIIILEEFIGRKSDDTDFSGFIDIVIKDSNNVVLIENKIYAGDQYEQLKRYKNYYPHSVLLYLNLTGNPPSIESTVDLEENVDYHIISYYNEISTWLVKCHKEAIEQSILRETIKQYSNLIKMLTNQTINDKMSEEIIKAIQRDFKSAQEISKNYSDAKSSILNLIRDKVLENLENKLNDKYVIYKSEQRVDEYNSSIIIKAKNYADESSFFCINSFSGLISSDKLLGKTLFIGILDYDQNNRNYFLEAKKNRNISEKGWWWEVVAIKNFEDFNIDLSDLNFLQFLANDNSKITGLVNHIVNFVMEYIERNEQLLLDIFENKKSV